MISPRTKPCPVDGTPSPTLPIWDGSRLFTCPTCGLRFYEKLTRPDDIMDRAYRGLVAEASMQEYWFRGTFLSSGDTDFLASPGVRASLEWIERNVPRPATILDVGCGRGHHLRSLRAMGHDAIGLDLSETVAAILAPQGFRVHVGPAESYPRDWPEPSVVTSNFVLHHAADPISFLRAIRDRFPDATVVIAQGLYPTWTHAFGGFVPRTRPGAPRNVTAWTPRAIDLALRQAGYDNVELTYTPPSWRDIHLRLQPAGARWASRWLKRDRSATLAYEGGGAEPPATPGIPAWMVVAGLRSIMLGKAWLYWLPGLVARARRLAPAAVVAIARSDS